MGVCGLGSIRWVLLSMAKDKKIFTIIEWVENRGLSSISPLTQVFSKVVPIFFRGARSNPVSPFPEDRKFITLISIEEDGMISHNLCNLVLEIPE